MGLIYSFYAQRMKEKKINKIYNNTKEIQRKKIIQKGKMIRNAIETERIFEY